MAAAGADENGFLGAVLLMDGCVDAALAALGADENGFLGAALLIGGYVDAALAAAGADKGTATGTSGTEGADHLGTSVRSEKQGSNRTGGRTERPNPATTGAAVAAADEAAGVNE